MRDIRCNRCGAPATTELTTVIAHPGNPSCERCAIEVQVIHARARAAALPELETRLTELGGPAEQILCGYIQWLHIDDPLNSSEWPFDQFCILPDGHVGFHKVAA